MKIKLLFIGIITTLFLLGCGDNEGQVIALSGIIESTNVNITAKVSGELRKVNFDEFLVNKHETAIGKYGDVLNKVILLTK